MRPPLQKPSRASGTSGISGATDGSSDGGGSPRDAGSPNGQLNGPAANDSEVETPNGNGVAAPNDKASENGSANGRLDSQTSSNADGVS